MLKNSQSQIRWLVGETLVIVFGVLIALGLDDFWTNRQERVLEADYLSRIQSDLRSDIGYLENVRKVRLALKFEAIDAVAPVVRGQAPVPDDVETFLINVSLGGLLGAANSNWTTNTTFEDLKSTGNLRLIRDTDLRRGISNYYHFADMWHSRVQGRQTDYVDMVHKIIPAELRENLDTDALNKFGVDRALEKILSPAFQDVLNQEMNYAYFLQSQNERARIDELLGEIRAYTALQ